MSFSAHTTRPRAGGSHPRTGACRLVVSLLSLLAFGAGPVAGQQPTADQRAALEEAEALADLVAGMSQTLWDYSETALRETRSASYLAGILQDEGFSVEMGVASMPTAFVASWGSGAPVIGVLAEFDALPGIGNAPRPERSDRDDAWPHGHGCGHNLFGAASVGSALAVKRMMERRGLEGTIRLYGTPAEETLVGKVYMARAGAFDDLDAALEWHPDLETATSNRGTQAMNNFEVEFRGQAAHAAFDPWNGRSALDGVELMNDGVNLLREHIRPTTRIHYVIPSAGEAPNVVPEYARVWYYVRDENRDLVERYYSRVLDVARGAAIATQTEHTVRLITGVHAVRFNRPLQEAVHRNLEWVGAPNFSEEEQQFGKRLQALLELEQTGFKTGVTPLAQGVLPMGGGSTDVAEVSRITPTVGFTVATAPAEIPWHSWATSAAHGTSAAVKGAQIAARVLAVTAVQLLTDADLLARARAAFEEAVGGPYVSPLPADAVPPVPADVAGPVSPGPPSP